MKRLLIVAMMFSCGAGAVLAADDVIAQRQALMRANGKAAQAVGGMLKGAPFDLAAAQAALKTFAEAGAKGPALFPPDSKTGEDTEALPAIWDNKPDFEARFFKLAQDASAAAAATTDVASLKTSVVAVFQDCGGCHEKYRFKKN
jgi:cytochrome c556